MSRPTSDSEIRFEIAIPAGDAWNGRYMQVGNGGFAGHVPEHNILERLASGYATAGTDDGHQDEDATDASWALGHPEKVKDFGYRALKETTDAARAIVLAYAGHAPARSYFVGCSDGGREALMEAQRYPGDFDGIVAGAPANHGTHLFYGAAWAEQALLATPRSYVPDTKLRAIEAAALKACGDEDGVIEDPLGCHFDPGVLRCKGAENDACLNDAQIQAVRAIYAGPKVPGTSPPIIAGYEPGSEAEDGGWHDWLVGKGPGADGGAAMYLFPQSFFRNVVFADPTYDLLRFRFDADVAKTDAKYAPSSTRPTQTSARSRSAAEGSSSTTAGETPRCRPATRSPTTRRCGRGWATRARSTGSSWRPACSIATGGRGRTCWRRSRRSPTGSKTGKRPIRSSRPRWPAKGRRPTSRARGRSVRFRCRPAGTGKGTARARRATGALRALARSAERSASERRWSRRRRALDTREPRPRRWPRAEQGRLRRRR